MLDMLKIAELHSGLLVLWSIADAAGPEGKGPLLRATADLVPEGNYF